MSQNADTAASAAAAAADASMDVRAALGEAWAKVTGWVEGLVESVPNVIAALVVLLLFWGLARLIRRVVGKLVGRVTAQPEVTRLVATASYVAVLILGVLLALGALNLDKTVTSILAGAGILGLALGFALQDIAENFIAGIILNVRDQFSEGDIVESGDFMGTIERVYLRATVLRTFTGQRVLIPNAMVFKNPIINYSQPGSRRVDVAVGVSYGDDLERARDVAIQAIEGLEERDDSRGVELFYEEFGGSSINFQLRFWVRFSRQTDYLRARSEAIMRIKAAFDEAGITIPFPITTLDFGIVGGQTFAESAKEAGLGRGG
jgi:small conductance mechanosensitive channel